MSPRLTDRLIARVPLLAELRTLWAADARWARILEIHRVGPFARILLEVHEGASPPFECWVRTRIPRGRDPRVGDDVYWTDHTSQGSTALALSIRWGTPPNYGAAPDDVAARERAAVDGIAASPLWREAAAAADPLAQLERAHAEREAGELTETQFRHRKEDLLAWASGDPREQDPATHLRRLEQRRARGEITDAEYAQRRADLERWAQNAPRVRRRV